MKSRSAVAKKEPLAPVSEERSKPRVVGEVVMRDLSLVRPNTWNPNEMTPFERQSLRHGLDTDGWLKSQSLLIWGSDEKGRPQNIIIDGEQRWTVATESGFKKGPMVFLEKMTKAQARALTVKMDQKRGHFNRDKLGLVLREIQYEFADDFALNIGIPQEELMPMLAEPEIVLPGDDLSPNDNLALPGTGSGLASSSVRAVQLVFNPETLAEFNAGVRKLAAKYKTTSVSDTVLETIRDAARSA